jgi:hypothetical protein
MKCRRPTNTFILLSFSLVVFANLMAGCSKLDELDETPNLKSLEDGFRTSALVGYCTSLMVSAFKGEPLPPNASFSASNKPGFSGAGTLTLTATKTNPIPFNSNVGKITIVGLWDGQKSGVVSIILADFGVIASQFQFRGMHTLPFTEKNGKIEAVYAKQDIVIGQGSDTLLNLSLTNPQFNTEINRLNSPQPTDVFIAASQNVWFLSIDRKNTSTPSDDSYSVSGGGQIAEVRNSSGGVLYHAMINTKFAPATCASNPTSGRAFIQNIQAGATIDLGNIVIEFRSTCDGRAKVIVATGKYIGSNGRDIILNWN